MLSMVLKKARTSLQINARAPQHMTVAFCMCTVRGALADVVNTEPRDQSHPFRHAVIETPERSFSNANLDHLIRTLFIPEGNYFVIVTAAFEGKTFNIIINLIIPHNLT